MVFRTVLGVPGKGLLHLGSCKFRSKHSQLNVRLASPSNLPSGLLFPFIIKASPLWGHVWSEGCAVYIASHHIEETIQCSKFTYRE